MKRLLPLLLLLPCLAHASWFEFEAGIGAASAIDVGDGVWQQKGVADSHVRHTTPALMGGLTGDITDHLAWHLDYMYTGETSARCVCVGDENYNQHTHIASAPGSIPFNGHGHTQGVFFTLEPNWTSRNGIRIGMEIGPFVYLNSWHESRNDPQYPNDINLSHRAALQVGGVAGASIGRGSWKLAYRYFYIRQQWNPYPALSKGIHMVTVQWTFR